MMSSSLGKRYYESVENASAGAADDEPEDDYLSDKFLAEIEAKEKQSKHSGVKTYTQLRKEAQKRKEEKGYIKPRAEREREAREEGLKRNLMTASTATSTTNGSTWKNASTSGGGISSGTDDTPPPTHGGNKALSMMMKMGFKPGEALGRKVGDSKGKGRAMQVTADDSDKEEEDTFAGLGARRGIGSKEKEKAKPAKDEMNEDFISINDLSGDEQDTSASHSAQTRRDVLNHRIDPIEIQMRTGRGGLGVEEAKRRKLATAASKERKGESLADYRSRARSNHSERRAEGQLKSVRETCLALDERENIKSNHMWLDPLEEYHKEREKTLGARSRFRIKEREGLGGEFDEDNEYGDDQAVPRGSGKRDNLHEELALESDEEDIDTEEAERREQAKNEFLRMSAVDRLKVTLEYLRQRHHYCFWCGTAYSSAEELASECPGPEEDDH